MLGHHATLFISLELATARRPHLQLTINLVLILI
eukprot:SAG31_NODE_31467_length_367_cov_31.343284_1_plen_33_part_10